jgi:hypothetical protein
MSSAKHGETLMKNQAVRDNSAVNNPAKTDSVKQPQHLPASFLESGWFSIISLNVFLTYQDNYQLTRDTFC